jgi:serine O-acetyltransferase
MHPGFVHAVVADARAAARFRSEHHEFRSTLDGLVQAVRLAIVTESFFALCCYRAKAACQGRNIPILPVVLQRLAVTFGQISVGDLVVIQPGIYIPHGQVVIDGLTSIGEGVVVRPFVTLGLRDGDVRGPVIGARVKIGTGAKVFGPVTVGPGAEIGANAVVNRDVPAGATAVGVPARVLP